MASGWMHCDTSPCPQMAGNRVRPPLARLHQRRSILIPRLLCMMVTAACGRKRLDAPPHHADHLGGFVRGCVTTFVRGPWLGGDGQPRATMAQALGLFCLRPGRPRHLQVKRMLPQHVEGQASAAGELEHVPVPR